jgi:hypothetical protein
MATAIIVDMDRVIRRGFDHGVRPGFDVPGAVGAFIDGR